MTRPMVMICAWCDNAADRTTAARDAGYDVTHGICEHCAEGWEIELEADLVDVAPLPGATPVARRES